MSTQTMSIESLYANGMGIELPINNNDTKQAQESYPCSNIIDLQSIENDLNYLNVFNTLDNTHTNDMIKLHNKLNKEYGKHSQALESYLDTRIKSMESGVSDKIKKAFKMFLDKLIEFFKIFSKKIQQFISIIKNKLKIKPKYNPNSKNIKTTIIYKNIDFVTINNFNEFISNMINNMDRTNKYILSVCEGSPTRKNVNMTKLQTDSFLQDVTKGFKPFNINIESEPDSVKDEIFKKIFKTEKISDETEMDITEIYKDGKQVDLIFKNIDYYILFMNKIHNSLDKSVDTLNKVSNLSVSEKNSIPDENLSIIKNVLIEENKINNFLKMYIGVMLEVMNTHFYVCKQMSGTSK